MKLTYPISIESLINSKLWLLGIASGLMAIHLTLTWRAEDSSLWGVSALFWIAVGSLMWSKRDSLILDSDVFSSFFGTFLISVILLKSLFLSGYDPFLRIYPCLSALSIALLASGFNGLKQYWRELLILCFIAPSPGVLSLLLDISLLTAQFATALLWYLGFNVARQGVYIFLPTSLVEVYSGCSGIESMLQLLGLALVFLMMFPTNRIEKVIVPVIASLIAFVVNGVRVAVLATLASPSTQIAFDYWHKGDGSLLFSMLAVLIFGLFCFFLLRFNEPDNHDPMESQEP
ncbi:MAG TPA: cyanoexosortase A [Coleofasciculaceae cyanobacterium]